VDVVLEDRHKELFWLPKLEVVDEGIAVEPFTDRTWDQRRNKGSWLPFGYNLECDADLLILRRSDGSFVAAFGAGNVDLFEVEWAVWEDTD
jgi:hypothetical protein